MQLLRHVAHSKPNRIYERSRNSTIAFLALALAVLLLANLVSVGHVEAKTVSSGELDTLSSGYNHTCALRTDGSPICWDGYDASGDPPPNEKFVSISSGFQHTCALRSNGSPVCWGTRELTPPHNEKFVAISSGAYHTCALRPDGSPICWGDNSNGQSDPPPNEKIAYISSGGTHTCALRPDGSPICWGGNSNGQSDPPPNESFVSISSGESHTCGLRVNGSLRCWSSYMEELMAGSLELLDLGYFEEHPPTGFQSALLDLAKYQGDLNYQQQLVSISSGAGYACALRTNGSPVCWAWNDTRLLEKVPTNAKFRISTSVDPPAPTSPFNERITLSSGYWHTCALRTDGSPACWGQTMQAEDPHERFVTISSGGWHTCALRRDGAAVCWGENTDGQSQPPFNERFATLSSGGSFTCALRSDGSPVCWGENTDGQSQPPFNERFATLSSGRWHACALRIDGSPVCWGENAYGESAPPSNERFVAISSGVSYTCALRSDGSPVCWGTTSNGVGAPSGLKILGLTSVTSGVTLTCALYSDGSPVCWSSHLEPSGGSDQVQIPSDEQFVTISSGYYHACALRQDGSPLCWAINSSDSEAAKPPKENLQLPSTSVLPIPTATAMPILPISNTVLPAPTVVEESGGPGANRRLIPPIFYDPIISNVISTLIATTIITFITLIAVIVKRKSKAKLWRVAKGCSLRLWRAYARRHIQEKR